MKPFVLVKQFTLLFTMILVIFTLVSCGGSSSTNPNSSTGNWTATLYDTSNAVPYAFTVTLTQQDPSPSVASSVSATNFKLTTNTGCFTADSSTKVSGVLTVNDDFNGAIVNTLQLTIKGSNGTIVMRGPFSTSGISGPWELSQTACDSNGTFMMTRA